MRKKFFSKNNKIIDIDTWDIFASASELHSRYGWEGAMAWGNLIHNDFNKFGPGIQSGDIFLDIGANIGMSSIRAESCGASTIYAIEPDPDIFEVLEKNKYPNWILENVAIGAEEGEMQICKWPNYKEFRSVKSITLDQFFNKHKIEKIDYMKVDIEVHEKTAFQNVENKTWSKIKKIFFELHGFTQEERVNFIKFTLSKGFKNYHIRLSGKQDFFWTWK